MGNAKQEDQALLKDKEEGHNDGGGDNNSNDSNDNNSNDSNDNNDNNSNNNNKGTRSGVTLNPLMQSNVWSTFRSVASKNQCYDEMPNILFGTEAAKAQLKGNMFLICFCTFFFFLWEAARSEHYYS